MLYVHGVHGIALGCSRPLTNDSRDGNSASFSIFQRSQRTLLHSYKNIPLRVSKSKSSKLRLRNSDRVIFNLSLSKYDANFSKLILRNLNKSINRNFIQVFFWSFLMLSTCFVNEMYFSLIMGSSSVRPLRDNYILDNVFPINYEKLWECNMNLYNLSCNLSARGLYITLSSNNDRIPSVSFFDIRHGAFANFLAKSAIGRLVENIDSTLCAKLRRTMRFKLPWRNRYMHNELLYEQCV